VAYKYSPTFDGLTPTCACKTLDSFLTSTIPPKYSTINTKQSTSPPPNPWPSPSSSATREFTKTRSTRPGVNWNQNYTLHLPASRSDEQRDDFKPTTTTHRIRSQEKGIYKSTVRYSLPNRESLLTPEPPSTDGGLVLIHTSAMVCPALTNGATRF
jgi:hypothetical protein